LKNRIITLTTDFGYQDPFAGVVKGAVLMINPLVNIVDLTHGIRPHEIKEAALTISMNYAFFPAGTIHIVVVDPGVVSIRRPLIVIADNHYFVGPDNGIFSGIYNSGKEKTQVVHVTADHYFLKRGGSTFHARDIFAPIGAYLSTGVNLNNFGEIITDYVNIPLPVSQTKNGSICGEVIFIDRFGNAITNIKSEEITGLRNSNPSAKLIVLLKNREIPSKDYYSQAMDKEVYFLLNSSDLLEFFSYMGNASSDYGISAGDAVEVTLK
jgi:S-adenosyl-L-methionine hydrolase (adenosine-forming)